MSLIKKLFKSNKNNVIYTIDAEYGASADEIANKIASKLNIKFYDEEVIELKTLESNVDVNFINKDDSFLQGTIYDLYRENYSYSQEDISKADAIFLANSQIIRTLAKDGPCILMGKCAGYVLKDGYRIFNIFISADEEDKIKTISKRFNYERDKAILEINKMDTRRSNHYNRFTGEIWGESKNYDMTINSSKYNIDTLVELIIEASKIKR